MRTSFKRNLLASLSLDSNLGHRVGSLVASFMVGAQFLLPPILVFGNSLYPPSVVAAELSDIRERGYLTVAVKDNRAPLGFVDETGNLRGFEIDIARRLAEELLGESSAIRLVPVQNVDRLNAVLEDRVDMAIAAVTITEPRRRLVDFSYPYYLDGVAFITNTPAIETLQDLGSGNIALLDRSSTVPHVRYVLPFATLVSVDSYSEGQQLLNEGSVDAFAGDLSVLTGWQRASGPQSYQILSSYLSVEPLSVVLPKGTQYNDLRQQVNRALQRWYLEGWLQSRAAYWGLPADDSQFINLGPEPVEPEAEMAPVPARQRVRPSVLDD